MSKKTFRHYPGRRRFLKLAGSGLALSAGGLLAPSSMRKLLPVSIAEAIRYGDDIMGPGLAEQIHHGFKNDLMGLEIKIIG